MIVLNPFCDETKCRGRECWRSICGHCGGYMSIHLWSRERAENMGIVHHCRPLSVPATGYEALATQRLPKVRSER